MVQALQRVVRFLFFRAENPRRAAGRVLRRFRQGQSGCPWDGRQIKERGSMRFHHLGIAVSSIRQTAPGISAVMALGVESDLIHDPIQRVSALFLHSTVAGPRVELIEPASEDSPIRLFLKKNGTGLHHVCYEVADIDGAIRDARARGGRIVCHPVAAPAFRGGRVAFVYTRERMLVEFAEAPVRFVKGLPFLLLDTRAADSLPPHA